MNTKVTEMQESLTKTQWRRRWLDMLEKELTQASRCARAHGREDVVEQIALALEDAAVLRSGLR